MQTEDPRHINFCSDTRMPGREASEPYYLLHCGYFLVYRTSSEMAFMMASLRQVRYMVCTLSRLSCEDDAHIGSFVYITPRLVTRLPSFFGVAAEKAGKPGDKAI